MKLNSEAVVCQYQVQNEIIYKSSGQMRVERHKHIQYIKTIHNSTSNELSLSLSFGIINNPEQQQQLQLAFVVAVLIGIKISPSQIETKIRQVVLRKRIIKLIKTMPSLVCFNIRYIYPCSEIIILQIDVAFHNNKITPGIPGILLVCRFSVVSLLIMIEKKYKNKMYLNSYGAQSKNNLVYTGRSDYAAQHSTLLFLMEHPIYY